MFLATVYVCNTNRLTWWALLSTWQPLRREGHLFMPACIEGSPRRVCNRPSSFRYFSHQLPISPSSPPPALLSPPSRSAGPFAPETRVMSGDSWWTSQKSSYERQDLRWWLRTQFPGNTSAPRWFLTWYKFIRPHLRKIEQNTKVSNLKNVNIKKMLWILFSKHDSLHRLNSKTVVSVICELSTFAKVWIAGFCSKHHKI